MTRESENTWGAVAAVTLVASVMGGIFLLEGPLESRRPKQQAALLQTDPADEIVPTRLWQDPLHAIQSHWNSIVSYKAEHKALPTHVPLPPTIKDLSKQLKTRKSCQSELRLLVMMRGGPYAEDREDRRRQRHAVVSALTENDYVPEDAERIGYTVAPSFKEVCQETGNDGVDSPHRMFIGFEFYKRSIDADTKAYKKKSDRKAKSEQPCESVLVLWLNPRDFRRYPLQRLSVLMAHLDDKRSHAGWEPPTSVLLGPETSGTLQRMEQDKDCSLVAKECREAVRHHEDGISKYIDGLRILSPRATVPLHRLFPGRKDLVRTGGVSQAKSVDNRFGCKLRVASFNSVVARDDLVIKEILNELVARGANNSLIAVVSEQDSAYGRLLYDIVDEEVESLKGHEFVVMKYGYLRGVDGELPPASPELAKASVTGNGEETVSGQTIEKIESLFMTSGRRESAFGVAQLDYVRRLADHIAYDLSDTTHHNTDSDNEKPNENDEDRPVVIGILGTDVYDKLLILQALRQRLPSANFFTTDLDARLTDPDVYAWTRNLIVGSSYGLTADGLKGAWFRDSYQAALYRAVTLALDQKYEETAPCPRLFEIARTGAVDITPHQDSCANTANDNDQGTIHYVRSTLDRWSHVWSALIVLTPLLALTIYACLRRRVLVHHRQKAKSWVRNVGLVSIACLALLLLCLHSFSKEPLLFFEGVSSVPTIILHLTALVFAYGLIHIAVGIMHQEHSNIHEKFGLPKRLPKNYGKPQWMFRNLIARTDQEGRRAPPWIWEWQRDLSADKGTATVEKKAAICWKRYLNYNHCHARVARISISVVVTYVLLLGILKIFNQLDIDPLLTRDVYWLSILARYLAIFATLVTFFFSSDTLKLGQAVLHEVAQHDIVGWAEVARDDRIKRRLRTMEFVADYTGNVRHIAVLPFILVSLLILARNPLFEGWRSTMTVWLVYAAFALYMLFRVFLFQREAMRAKKAILEALDKYRLQAAGDAKESSRIEIARERINGMREGAFVPWTRHPILQSLLLPSGTYGVVVLLEAIL